MARERWYVGLAGRYGDVREVFSSPVEPRQGLYGSLYGAIIGPFDTKCTAKWAEVNPGFGHVSDAADKARAEGFTYVDSNGRKRGFKVLTS